MHLLKGYHFKWQEKWCNDCLKEEDVQLRYLQDIYFLCLWNYVYFLVIRITIIIRNNTTSIMD